MEQLTLTIDNYIDDDIKNYLFEQPGINNIDVDYDTINIEYDSSKIKLNIIYLESLAFMKSLDLPTLKCFDKHSKNNLKEYDITINDLCCEYCMMGMIEHLFNTDGISFATSSFFKDYSKYKDLKINIKYDPNIISLEEIKKIETNFNSSF